MGHRLRLERRKRRVPTSFVLTAEQLAFLQQKAKESSDRLHKRVHASHIVRALIRRAMDEDQEKGKVWYDEDL
jgi:hypothetical protein